jgi:hypothetical protein
MQSTSLFSSPFGWQIHFSIDLLFIDNGRRWNSSMAIGHFQQQWVCAAGWPSPKLFRENRLTSTAGTRTIDLSQDCAIMRFIPEPLRN